MRSQTAARTPSEEARTHIHKADEGMKTSERDENILVAQSFGIEWKGEEVQESEEKPFHDYQGDGKEGKEEGIKKKKAKRKEDQLLVDKEEDKKKKSKKEAM